MTIPGVPLMLTDLSVTPIAEPLRQLAVERRSGDLQVQSGRAVKTIFFDNGRAIFAASNMKKDRLGESLVAQGRITAEEYRQAEAYLKGDRKLRIGDALVGAGLLQKGEIGRMVARQVNRILLSTFAFTDGVASFEERTTSIPLEYMVSLSMHRVLYDGIKTMESQELVLAGLGHLDRRVKLNAVPPFGFDPKDSPAEEMDILEHAQRRVTLRHLAWRPGGLSFERLRASYALLAAGVLLDADAAEEPQPVVHMETGTFLLSALQRQPDPTAREAVRREVRDELERSDQVDREAWLKVSRTAPREELVKAIEEKMERYHALRDALGDDDLRTDLEVILGRASALLRLARQDADDAGEPAPAPPARPGPAAAAAPAAPAEGIDASLDQLLLEAEVRMTVSDYPNAIKAFVKLVNRAPGNASYRAKLAIAMASYPRTAKGAEREFLEALRIEPDNPDLHYQFGMYYKIMKQRARALAEMQTAVRLNPRHAMARKELEALSPKDSALSSLKKLFR
jgi:tetratricopeptide (TPR) repeat protein